MIMNEDEVTREKFIETGLIRAELNEFFFKTLRDAGYAGMTLKRHESPIKIFIKVNDVPAALGENRTKLKQMQSLIAKRLNEDVNSIEIIVEKVLHPGLCPEVMAEKIRKQMNERVTHRRAVSEAVREIRAAGSPGCMIVISGKLKGQRAKSVKTIDGVILHSGKPKKQFVREAETSLLLKQGVIGIKVSIMLPQDDEGKKGPVNNIVDRIKVKEVGE
ncbi:40S ribosomal protein S3 [Dictyocoela roeselum]|nr:40S ribosomal protein S3 [Dictyocoela roeselum]